VEFGQVEGQVQRGASAAALGVVEIAAPQRDGAEEGVDGDGAVFVDGFAGQRGSVVGDELAVVEKVLDDPAGIAVESVAQAGFEPPGQCFDGLFFLGEQLARPGEEVLRFAVFLDLVLGLEAFFSAVSGAEAAEARRATVCWMLSRANCWQRSSKRWKLSMSSRRVRASPAATLRVWLRPSRQIWNL